MSLAIMVMIKDLPVKDLVSGHVMRVFGFLGTLTLPSAGELSGRTILAVRTNPSFRFWDCIPISPRPHRIKTVFLCVGSKAGGI